MWDYPTYFYVRTSQKIAASAPNELFCDKVDLQHYWSAKKKKKKKKNDTGQKTRLIQTPFRVYNQYLRDTSTSMDELFRVTAQSFN